MALRRIRQFPKRKLKNWERMVYSQWYRSLICSIQPILKEKKLNEYKLGEIVAWRDSIKECFRRKIAKYNPDAEKRFHFLPSGLETLKQLEKYINETNKTTD